MSETRRKVRRSTGEAWGQFAHVSVLLASFGQLALTDRLTGEPWQVPVVFGLGMVYGSLAVVSERWTGRGAGRAKAIYFSVQFLICCGLIGLSPYREFFWIVVLPLGAQAIFDLRWPWALLLNASLYVLSVGSLWLAFGPKAGRSVMLGFAPAFIFTAVFSYLTAQAFKAKQRAEDLSEQLEAANARLREQSAQAEELATVRERNRVAREIHDGLGHFLTVIHVQVAAARALIEREPARAVDSMVKAERLAREALDEVRASVSNLRREGATNSLAERLHALSSDCGLQVSCDISGDPHDLPAPAEHALYRAAQEGLTNVRRHAGTTEAELRLEYLGPTQVRLRVADRGRGPTGSAPAEGSGFGLRGIRERVEFLGGTAHAAARPGGGFELVVDLPR